MDDTRSNAVIAAAKKVIPNKPIRYAVALYNNIRRLKLDVTQHVPIHGNPRFAR